MDQEIIPVWGGVRSSVDITLFFSGNCLESRNIVSICLIIDKTLVYKLPIWWEICICNLTGENIEWEEKYLVKVLLGAASKSSQNGLEKIIPPRGAGCPVEEIINMEFSTKKQEWTSNLPQDWDNTDNWIELFSLHYRCMKYVSPLTLMLCILTINKNKHETQCVPFHSWTLDWL